MTSSSWIGTSEVPLAALHADEILDAGRAAQALRGISTCFRREAGAAGKDTRGIFRVHQFDKVEMFSFVRHRRLRGRARAPARVEEAILATSSSPTGSSNASATRRPAAESTTARRGSRARAHRELTSCSNTTDTRRAASAPLPPRAGRAPRAVHTLNGTATAVGRTLIALLENGQQADGWGGCPQRWSRPARRRRFPAKHADRGGNPQRWRCRMLWPGGTWPAPCGRSTG